MRSAGSSITALAALLLLVVLCGCANCRLPRAATSKPESAALRQRLDYPGMTGDGNFNMAGDLRFAIEVTAELLLEVDGKELVNNVYQVSIYSKPAERTPLRFEGYMRSFGHPAVFVYNDGYPVGDSDKQVRPDSKATATMQAMLANTLDGVANGKWVDDPRLGGDSEVSLDNIAPLFVLDLVLKTPDEQVRESRGEQYPTQGGRLTVAAFYRLTRQPELHYEAPVLFVFSGRTTAKVFALGEPYASKVHTLLGEMYDLLRDQNND
jgi:hypothetical protein